MKLILFFACLFFLNFLSFGQRISTPISQSHYLFPAFIKGTVQLKHGVKQEVLLNYNSLTEEMIFDNKGSRLALAQPETIDTVFIEGRRFVPHDQFFYEVIAKDPVTLLARHTCVVGTKFSGTNVGYGGTSQTTAAQARSAFIAGGQRYDLKLPDDYKITPMVDFFVKRYNHPFLIKNVRQVIKVFPEKEKEIKKFVKKNETNFSSQEDVLKLIQIL